MKLHESCLLWFPGCVVVWFCGCAIVCLCGCVIVWLGGCVVVWLYNSVVVLFSDCVVVWLWDSVLWILRLCGSVAMTLCHPVGIRYDNVGVEFHHIVLIYELIITLAHSQIFIYHIHILSRSNNNILTFCRFCNASNILMHWYNIFWIFNMC